MILATPIIKRVSLDTNADLINEEHNLEAVLKNIETNLEIISSSIFKEIVKQGVPTGIYFSDLEFTQSGQFLVTIRHKTLAKSGSSLVTINSGASYFDLEESILGLSVGRRDGVSFA